MFGRRLSTHAAFEARAALGVAIIAISVTVSVTMYQLSGNHRTSFLDVTVSTLTMSSMSSAELNNTAMEILTV